ncbi:hypothetical protein C8J56DRAFT_940700 [Mycena floridula]|nr:hypothetical protein C8J56DRAFT_940700 [Mycena floridula]
MAPDSYIDQTPTEILDAIFQICTIDDRNELTNPEYLTIMHLSQVCSRWRDIAHGNKQFWSRFSITLDHATTSSSLLLATFLEHSKDAVLIIHVESKKEVHSSQIARCNDLFSQLLAHSERWGQAHITVPQRTFSALFENQKLEFPNLNSLRLSSDGSTYLEAENRQYLLRTRAFLDVPKLSELHFEWMDSISLQSHLPWTQILFLTLNYLPIPATLSLIQQCPNLLFVNIDSFFYDDGDITPHITSLITSLDVRFIDSSDLSYDFVDDESKMNIFFDSMTLSDLEYLRITMDSDSITSFICPIPSLLRMLSRSTSTLTQLHLNLFGIEKHAFSQLLQYMPLLEILELLDIPWGEQIVVLEVAARCIMLEEVFELLIGDWEEEEEPDLPVLVPNLRELVFGSDVKLDKDDLLELFE